MNCIGAKEQALLEKFMTGLTKIGVVKLQLRIAEGDGSSNRARLESRIFSNGGILGPPN